MMKLRDERGLTLLELIITIAVGSIVTLAATTVMLLGLRIYNNSNQKALRQNEVRVAITVMENLLSEAANVRVEDNKVIADGDNGNPLLSCVDQAIKTGSGATILEGVSEFRVTPDGEYPSLLKFSMVVDDETYTFSVYCPVFYETEPMTMRFSMRPRSAEDYLTDAIHDEALAPGVRAFLKVLASQVGSTGRIRTEAGEGDYYSSWYIGGYEDNSGWSEETPWCVCFISWALEECRGYLDGNALRYANVDKLWAEFVTTGAWESDPNPGDIVIFDGDRDGNPEHAGVVIAAGDGMVHTIEGNNGNEVRICTYSSDYAGILGYGTINWN